MIFYLDLYSTDPAYNLAIEQYLFETLPKDRTCFMLWQNKNAVIIGRHQNTLAEINESFVREHSIQVVRRLSGGGAVYHDQGNLNFTFITDAGDPEQLNFRRFCAPIIKTLKSLGVNAEMNGRNDMTIGGRKFSGNAQSVKNGRVLHHGTILFNSDLDAVEAALNADTEKVSSKGIGSVRSRVTNVREHLNSDMDLSEFRKLLLSGILKELPGSEYLLTQEDLCAVDRLCAERYRTWEWNYGASPDYTIRKKRRFEGCGLVEIYLTVEQGLIRRTAFRGDFFSTEDPDDLAEYFTGLRPDRENYRKALAGLDVSRYFRGLTADDLLSLLSE